MNASTKVDTVDSKLTGLTTIVNQNYTDLQNQIDAAISTWFDSYLPTNQNEPAKTWIENKEEADVILGLAKSDEDKYVSLIDKNFFM